MYGYLAAESIESNMYCMKSGVLTIFRKVNIMNYILWFTKHDKAFLKPPMLGIKKVIDKKCTFFCLKLPFFEWCRYCRRDSDWQWVAVCMLVAVLYLNLLVPLYACSSKINCCHYDLDTKRFPHCYKANIFRIVIRYKWQWLPLSMWHSNDINMVYLVALY